MYTAEAYQSTGKLRLPAPTTVRTLMIGALVLYTLVVAAGAIIQLLDDTPTLPLVQHEDGTLQLSGLSLGMTQEALQRQVPSAKIATLANGTVTSLHTKDAGLYSVTYSRQGGMQFAQRIRYQQIIAGATNAAVVEALEETYGQPAKGACENSQGQQTCDLVWMLPQRTLIALNSQETGFGSVNATITLIDPDL